MQKTFQKLKNFEKFQKNYFTKKILKNWKKWFCKKFFQDIKNYFAKKILKSLRKWFAKKFFRKFRKMKNYFAKNFFRNLRMFELLANGIVKDFLYHVYTLQYLTKMEEQPKSFFLWWLFINSSQWHKIIRRSCTRFAFELEPKITKNCDVFTHSYDFCIVTTIFSRSYA